MIVGYVEELTSILPSSFIFSASFTFLMAPLWISTRSGKSCMIPRYSFSTSRAGSMSYLGWGRQRRKRRREGRERYSYPCSCEQQYKLVYGCTDDKTCSHLLCVHLAYVSEGLSCLADSVCQSFRVWEEGWAEEEYSCTTCKRNKTEGHNESTDATRTCIYMYLHYSHIMSAEQTLVFQDGSGRKFNTAKIHTCTCTCTWTIMCIVHYNRKRKSTEKKGRKPHITLAK